MRNILTPSTLKKLSSEGKKIKKYCDGDGLYLWVYEDGRKHFYFRYTRNKKSRDIYLGLYPNLTLAIAREKSQEYRILLAEGKDPVSVKKQNKLSESVNTFEKLTADWFDKMMSQRAESHKSKVWRYFEKDVFPSIGKKDINSVTSIDIISLLRRIEDRGALETAHRVLNRCSQVFQFGMILQVCKNNPCVNLSKILKPVKENHFSAPTSPSEVSAILKAIELYKGSFVVKSALRMAPYVFVRPGDLRHAKWEDIDLINKTWSFTTQKDKKQLIVPLADQVIKILLDLKEVTGNKTYLFTGTDNSRPISNNTISVAYKRLGIGDEITAHGWRATARTMLDEVLEYPPHIIEQQLSHVVRDPLGRAYNRTKHLEQRKKMMSDWADYLDKLREE